MSLCRRKQYIVYYILYIIGLVISPMSILSCSWPEVPSHRQKKRNGKDSHSVQQAMASKHRERERGGMRDGDDEV